MQKKKKKKRSYGNLDMNLKKHSRHNIMCAKWHDVLFSLYSLLCGFSSAMDWFCKNIFLQHVQMHYVVLRKKKREEKNLHLLIFMTD